MLETVCRFFRSIALFRRDRIADPQIDDRSGDDVCTCVWKASDGPRFGKRLGPFVICAKCDKRVKTRMTISLMDNDSDIA